MCVILVSHLFSTATLKIASPGTGVAGCRAERDRDRGGHYRMGEYAGMFKGCRTW